MLPGPNKTGKHGFSLIEVMIVVAIIGILAAISTHQFARYRQRSANSATQAELRNAATVQEAYFTDNETYTGTMARLAIPPYRLSTADDVTISITSATTTGYTMTGFHSAGNTTFTLVGPGSRITP